MLFLAVLALYASDRWFAASDTLELFDGVAVIDRCIEAGVWQGCEEKFGVTGGSAPLQYLAVLGFKRAGASRDDAFQYLAWLNTAAFAGTLLLMWLAGRRAGPRTAALLLLCGLSGPLFFYADSGFGEPLGAFWITAFAAALAFRRGVALIALTFFLAALGKGPNMFFLAGLGAAAVIGLHGRSRSAWRPAVGVATGFAVSAAAFAWIDRFRGGAVSGDAVVWVAERARLPDFFQRMEHLAGLFVAPNAGIVWFWPLAVATLGAATVIAWRARSRRDPRSLGALGVAAVVLLLLAGMASFYSPFGFIGWGPRYLIPWVPALLVLAVALFGEEIEAVLARATMLGRPAAAVLAVLIVLAGLPHIASRLDLVPYDRLYLPDDGCPARLMDPAQWYDTFGGMSSYYDCIRHMAWEKRQIFLDVMPGLGSDGVWGPAFALSFALAVALLVAYGWRAPARAAPV